VPTLVGGFLALLHRLQDPLDLGLLQCFASINSIEDFSDVTKCFASLGEINGKIVSLSQVDFCDLELCV
jgi:hypothetical protein